MHVGARIDDVNSDCVPLIYGILVRGSEKLPSWAGASGVRFCRVFRRESDSLVVGSWRMTSNFFAIDLRATRESLSFELKNNFELQA